MGPAPQWGRGGWKGPRTECGRRVCALPGREPSPGAGEVDGCGNEGPCRRTQGDRGIKLGGLGRCGQRGGRWPRAGGRLLPQLLREACRALWFHQMEAGAFCRQLAAPLPPSSLQRLERPRSLDASVSVPCSDSPRQRLLRQQFAFIL